MSYFAAPTLSGAEDDVATPPKVMWRAGRRHRPCDDEAESQSPNPLWRMIGLAQDPKDQWQWASKEKDQQTKGNEQQKTGEEQRDEKESESQNDGDPGKEAGIQEKKEEESSCAL